MPIFHLEISSVSRSAGRRATSAAAYRAGERIRDERTGEVQNYARRTDVRHAEIFLPGDTDPATSAWAGNRARLWNAAEHAEKRHNARVAREYQVTLPSELDATQRIRLARAFAREIADRYRVAVDLAVHDPRPGGDPRNYHAHLLTTTRELTPTGLGAKAGLDLSATERRRRLLPDHRQEYVNVRRRWAELTNESLREAGIDGRVDHRSLAAQGLDREPQPAIPIMHLKMEQRGVRSEVADRLRAAYRDRVSRRQERAAESGHDATRELRSQAPASAEANSPVGDLEAIRRRAREAWLRLRAEAARPESARESERSRQRENTELSADAAHPGRAADEFLP